MSSIRETLFDLLLNAVVQIGFFAVVAAVFSRFVAKAQAKHQYCFYLAVLLFSLAVPVSNTFWHSTSIAVAEKIVQPVLPAVGGTNPRFWIWQAHSRPGLQLIVPSGFQGWILGAWGVLVLLQLARFSLAVRRVRRLRRNASEISGAQFGMANQILGADHQVGVLESTAIGDPVTIGVFRPAILLPSKVLRELGEEDFSAILAHEYGHIRRRDYAVHVLCELISLPAAWHPGVRYLMSRISQTRELACDDYAAARLGERRAYAHTLLRVASLCLRVRRSDGIALGIFDGDSLEARIHMLTKQTLTLSRTGVIALFLTASMTFGVGAVLLHATSMQAPAEPSNPEGNFVGTWHWMFDGRSFATMILVRGGSGFTGSVTESRIALNDDGSLLRADPGEDTAPKAIAKARLEGSALRVTVKDGFEFMVTVKDDRRAEIHPVGAPPNMKPIPAEKVR